MSLLVLLLGALSKFIDKAAQVNLQLGLQLHAIGLVKPINDRRILFDEAAAERSDGEALRRCHGHR